VRRAGPLLATSVLLAGGLSLTAPAGIGARPASAASYCAPTRSLAVADAPDATDLFALQGPGWTSGDGGYSATARGTTLWFMNDSMVLRQDGSPVWIRNSVRVQRGGTFTTLMGGTEDAPQLLIPDDRSDAWWWFGGAAVEGNRVRALLQEFILDPAEEIGLKFTGRIGVATFDLTNPAEPRFTGTKTRLVNAVARYGDAVYNDAQFSYLYGAEAVPDPANPGYLLVYTRLARVARGHLTDRAWQYWTGSRWSTSAAKSRRLSNVNYKTTAVVKRKRGGYVMLTIPEPKILRGTTLTAAFACTPHGPWSPRRTIANVPDLGPYTDPATGAQLRKVAYMAMPHAGVTAGGGLLISYNRNVYSDAGDPWAPLTAIWREPSLYQLRFLRVAID
jgi:hypothetical protein